MEQNILELNRQLGGEVTNPSDFHNSRGPETDPRMTYRSVVEGRWDENATVRVRSRPIHQQATETALAKRMERVEYYSRTLVPAAAHPLLLKQAREVQSALLLHYNYAFAKATSTLETNVLNPTLLDLANGLEHISLPEALRFDARRIYVDESYHSLVAEDSIRQLAAATGIAPIRQLKPPSFDQIGEVADEFGRGEFPLVRFLFSFVLETLVSDTFLLLPDDPSVHPMVRDVVGQHRQDEPVHHAFFRDAFLSAWPGLASRDRAITAEAIPRFITGILAPDDSQLELILREIGIGKAEAATVVADSYAASPLTGNVRKAAKATLRYCRQAGLLNDPAAQVIFRRARLID